MIYGMRQRWRDGARDAAVVTKSVPFDYLWTINKTFGDRRHHDRNVIYIQRGVRLHKSDDLYTVILCKHTCLKPWHVFHFHLDQVQPSRQPRAPVKKDTAYWNITATKRVWNEHCEGVYSESSLQAFNFFRSVVLQHAPPRPEVRVNICKDGFHITLYDEFMSPTEWNMYCSSFRRPTGSPTVVSKRCPFIRQLLVHKMQEEKVYVFYLLLQRTKGLGKSDLKMTQNNYVECQKMPCCSVTDFSV